jgi:hypothetical protein
VKLPTKHKAILIAIPLAFIYLGSTVIWERYAETLKEYEQLTSLEKSLVTPEALSEKETILHARLEAASSALVKSGGEFKKDANGVVEFVESLARRHHIRLESFEPIEAKPSPTGLQGIPFRAKFSCPFHTSAQFVNELEEGPFPVAVTKLSLSGLGPKGVGAELEAVAYIIGNAKAVTQSAVQ